MNSYFHRGRVIAEAGTVLLFLIIFEDTVRFQLIPQLPHLQQPTLRIWVQILYKIIKTASELSDHSGSLCLDKYYQRVS
jgi:hypothetical protein